MQSSKKLLKSSSLYLILDRSVNNYKELFSIAQKAIACGVDIIQLRDKQSAAKDIYAFSESLVKISRGKSLFIVNDRVDIAQMSGADGVHLGQEDLPVEHARKILGPSAVIGVSCQTLAHVKEAEKHNANYIGFGSVFKTLTKPLRKPMNLTCLKKVLQETRIPVFCIGGINLSNFEIIHSLGCSRVAVCRDICKAKDIEKVISQYQKMLLPK